MKISMARFAGSSTCVARKPQRRLPEFAFIGRSNVGKSSLINSLCGNSKLAITSSTPGKTRLINHFLINDKWYLVDLPGYGYAKGSRNEKQIIADIINDYIMNSEELEELFVLIDSRHDLMDVDLGFISELGEHGIPFSIIWTKCDKMGGTALERQIRTNCSKLLESWEYLPQTFTSSSTDGRGREEILNHIEEILKSS